VLVNRTIPAEALVAGAQNRDGYDLICRYSAQAPGEWSWYGAEDSVQWHRLLSDPGRTQCTQIVLGNRALLRRIDRCELTSNSLHVEIMPLSPSSHVLDTAAMKGKKVQQLREYSRDPISRDDAFIIAQNICLNEKWKWINPIIAETDTAWTIATNSPAIDENVRIILSKHFGRVIKKTPPVCK
jgi:hypothetical protein